MRTSQFNIDDQFLKRFSPRKFKQKAIAENDLKALIEAASTAPSCFNEQPWVFVLASKDVMVALLTAKNALWAKEAAEIMHFHVTQNRIVGTLMTAALPWGI